MLCLRCWHYAESHCGPSGSCVACGPATSAWNPSEGGSCSRIVAPRESLENAWRHLYDITKINPISANTADEIEYIGFLKATTTLQNAQAIVSLSMAQIRKDWNNDPFETDIPAEEIL